MLMINLLYIVDLELIHFLHYAFISLSSGLKGDSDQYEEDFDSTVTTQSKSLSSQSGSTLTQSSSSIEVPPKMVAKDDSSIKPPVYQMTALRQSSEHSLNESASSADSVYSTRKLLDRSNTHRQISDHSRAGEWLQPIANSIPNLLGNL